VTEQTRVMVFVEEDCFACERALLELNHLQTYHPQLAIQVYDRRRDREEFEKFNVHAVPAIFIDDELTSYGSSVGFALRNRLENQPTIKRQEVSVERKSLGRGITAGLVGTAVMTMVMLMGPLMGLPDMNIGRMLGGFMGIPEALGWIAHFMIGTVIALIYVYFFAARLPDGALIRGALYGLIPWFVSQIMVNPMMGAGIFASNTPAPFMMVLGSLMGHVIYGGVVGGVYGSGSSKRLLNEAG
jgi:hypothetical protein